MRKSWVALFVLLFGGLLSSACDNPECDVIYDDIAVARHREAVLKEAGGDTKADTQEGVEKTLDRLREWHKEAGCKTPFDDIKAQM